MVFSNFLTFQISILIVLSTQSLAETVTNQLPDSVGGTKEVLIPGLPQGYYIPYQKYVSSPGQKFVSAPENQIPVTISTTEKTIPSSYKATLDATKYAISQAIKQTQTGSPASYPYLYTLAATPSTTPKYVLVPRTQNELYEEVPKKYHYGYRVSNPHTGAEFGHSEVNDGISAKGYYHVLLPDGRLQNVKYWAGPSGYHATITYENQY